MLNPKIALMKEINEKYFFRRFCLFNPAAYAV